MSGSSKPSANQLIMPQPPRPHVELWTDGSGTVWPEPGGWAFILRFRKGDEWIEREVSGGVDQCTNNRMELTALLEGLKQLKQPCDVTVFTDSEYVANPFKKGWLANWKRRNWSKVKNDDLWKEILRAAAMHRLEFKWVKGHSGVSLNERCDVLAGRERQRMYDVLVEEAAAF